MGMKSDLAAAAKCLVARGKGILAADDDDKEMFRRFSAMGIEATTENLHDYWEILFTAAAMPKYISGVILCEEALLLRRATGLTFAQSFRRAGVLTGIVLDSGTKMLASTDAEEIAIGTDALRERLEIYSAHGAQFSKWRAVFSIGVDKPSNYCIEANAVELARFAFLSQAAGLVPFVEPDVLIDGDHSLDRCREVTSHILARLFDALEAQNVQLDQMILKPNMVLQGRDHPGKPGIAEVAAATMDVLKEGVPAAVSGIAFLSGGQSDQTATAHLNAMNASDQILPWALTFCFGRALQARAMSVWNGDRRNAEHAQRTFLHRARLNSLAQLGQYDARLENESAMTQPVAASASG